jgi:hypothetical protein
LNTRYRQRGSVAWLHDPVSYLGVTADVKLTHIAEVILTHLGEDGGFCAADADSGASSGDSGVGPTRDGVARDRAANGAVAQHGAAVLAPAVA